jgi:ATP/maltotriose-dependent transcriptional regulator MalT
VPPPLPTTKPHIPPLRPSCVQRPRLIERLNSSSRRKLVLVSAPAGFGKTTLLSESEPVDQAISFLLARARAGMQLVIFSRTDPLLPQPRLRARGQLTEPRENDLRFTHGEAAAFLQQTVRNPARVSWVGPG